ncbi:MAG: hypothetical protein ACRESK_05085, partial [Gammaproteobacteria bacterium]
PVDISTALILGYLGSSVFLVLNLGFDFDEYHKVVFSVYPLVSYAIAALWLGIGLSVMVKVIMRKLAAEDTRSIVPAGFSALLVISTCAVNAAWNYRHDDNWAGLYALTVLNSLPPDSVLFSEGLAEGAIAYMNKIEGFREDINLHSAKGVLLKDRLYHPLQATGIEAGKAIEQFIKSQVRPIYDISGLFPHFEQEYYGLYSRLSKNADKYAKTVTVLPEFLDYWNFIQGVRPRHPWENIHQAYLLRLGCKLLTMAGDAPVQNRQDFARIMNMRDGLCNNLAGSYIMLNSIMRGDNPDWDRVRLLLERAQDRLHEALLKSDVSQLDFYRGMMYLQTGDREKGRYFLAQSLLKWDHPLNKAGEELKKITDGTASDVIHYRRE